MTATKRTKTKPRLWFVYVQSKESESKYLYHSETTLGEAEAMLTAADLTAKGSRVFICNEYLSDGFIPTHFNLLTI